MAEEKLNKFVINYLTEEQYAAALEAGTLNENDFYCTSEEDSEGNSSYVTKEYVDSKIDEAIEENSSNIQVNPTDTSNMNIWIETE